MGYVDVLGQFVKYPIPIPACLQYASPHPSPSILSFFVLYLHLCCSFREFITYLLGRYAINVCEALVEVHQRMLAHRNVNPTTIVVHETGEAHLDGLHLAYNCVTDLSFTIDTTYVYVAVNVGVHAVGVDLGVGMGWCMLCHDYGLCGAGDLFFIVCCDC